MTKEDMEKLTLQKLPLKDFPEDVEFNTHGMSIRHEDQTLYAINHAFLKGGERVEVFKIRSDPDKVPYQLDYQYSITSDWLKKYANGLLNGIQVVDANKFYVSRFYPYPVEGNKTLVE